MFHQVRKYLLLIKSDADPKYGSCCVSVCLDVCLGVSGCVWVCLGVSGCVSVSGYLGGHQRRRRPPDPTPDLPTLAGFHTHALSPSLPRSLALFRYLPSHPRSLSLSPVTPSRSLALALFLSRSLALSLSLFCPHVPETHRYWKPNLLLLVDDPNLGVLGFCNNIKKGGLLVTGGSETFFCEFCEFSIQLFLSCSL